MQVSSRSSARPELLVYQVRPFSRLRMPASRTVQGVLKSGSPTPSEMQSYISAAMSKNVRMPEGRMSRAAAEMIFA